MEQHAFRKSRLALLICVFWAAVIEARADGGGALPWNMAPVPLEQVPASVRDRVHYVLEKPTLTAQGPAESFTCTPGHYYWFLDHPDRAVRVWRRLGAKCLEITDRGNGRFGWSDGQGSDIHWDTVFDGRQMRVWYAEGQVKPRPLLPAVPVRAVLTLRFTEGRDHLGRPMIQHQADLKVHTNSRGAALATRMLGHAVPRMAQTYAAQMEMFFSMLCWYLGQHPHRIPELFAGIAPVADSPRTPQPREYSPALRTVGGIGDPLRR